MEFQSKTTQPQNPTVIMQPPNIVSNKDSLYLSDTLSWNLLAMKKAHFFSEQCQDTEVKNVLEKVCHMHQRHYEQILTHLQTTNLQ